MSCSRSDPLLQIGDITQQMELDTRTTYLPEPPGFQDHHGSLAELCADLQIEERLRRYHALTPLRYVWLLVQTHSLTAPVNSLPVTAPAAIVEML